jgi:dihydrofolate reductase
MASNDGKQLAQQGSARPQVVLIAAVASNGVIGRDNGLLWRLPEDMQHFRRVTSGYPVLMGRKTWDSLPERFRPLPGRRNVVLTRHTDWQAEGAEAMPTLQDAFEALAGAERVFVIGGAQIYAAALPMADELILTEVHRDFDGDAHFPSLHGQPFVEVTRQPAEAPPLDGPSFDFVTYRRI